MKVVMFETTNVSPHLETALEIAKNHLDRGNQVEFHFLGHSLDYCEFVNSSLCGIIFNCLPEVIGSRLLRNKNFKFINPKKSDLMRKVDVPDFKNSESLRIFRYKNYNVGFSVLSSLISFLGSSKPNLDEYKPLLSKMLNSGISTYEYCLGILDCQKFDRVYLFNGRFVNNRAIFDAAIETKTPCYIHERGANKYLYTVTPYLPHDFERAKCAMTEAWDNRPVAAVETARSFFQHRRGGGEQGWISFTTSQKQGHLDAANIKKRLIAYFSSSDDEYESVGDCVKWDRWPNQLSAVRALLSIVRNSPELELIVRLHPHMSQKHKADLQEWVTLELPSNARLLLPNDKTDSYALIDRADVVVTCGSTVGIESVFWGTPSICLGPSLYSHLDAVYLPKDESELEELLLASDLNACPEQALPYGYFMSTFGEPFVHYQPETLFAGRFSGVNLQNFGLCAYLRRLRAWIERAILHSRY
jgi:hypothetical protein